MKALSAVEVALGLFRHWSRADLEALALDVVEGEPGLSFPKLADDTTRRGLGKFALALEVVNAIRAADAAADYSDE